MHRITYALLGVLAWLAGCAPATATPPPTPTRILITMSPPIQQAYDLLRNTGRFSGPAVGVAATTPDTVLALRAIVQEPEAEKILQNLLHDAGLPGQLYALAGLYVLNPDEARLVAQQYETSNEQVETMFGCIVAKDTVGNVARQIMEGTLAYALAKPEP